MPAAPPETVDRRAPGHRVATVPEAGWAGKKNGELLRLAAPAFDAFVTMDQGLRFQQNLAALTRGTHLGVVVLRARTNRLEDLLPLVPGLLDALGALRPGQVVRLATDEEQSTPRAQ